MSNNEAGVYDTLILARMELVAERRAFVYPAEMRASRVRQFVYNLF